MSNIERHTSNPVPSSLDEQMRYARAVAEAGLAPNTFRAQPANVLIALDIAQSLNESAWTVMSEMSVISGRPSFSAKFMRSRVRQAGHKLRETYTDGVARAVIIRSDDPDFEHAAEWDEAKARDHDLWGKGHWRKNPVLMLKNRALSEVVREACYEVMGGIAYTPDEVMDFAGESPVVHAHASRTPAPAASSNHDRAAQALGINPQPNTDTVDGLLAEVETAGDDHDALRALWKRAATLPDTDKAAVRTIIEATIAAGQPKPDTPAPAEPETFDAEVVEEPAA